MTNEEILQKIISEEGSCEGWANAKICKICPMGRLKQRHDGTYASCIEAVGASNCSSLEEADAKYKKMAQKVLLDIVAEEHLFDDAVKQK